MTLEKDPKVSIIIPCYKTEKTLEDTLSSVSKLDYANWEAVIVNDGSPDNLEKIALEWVEKDKRFLYFKKPNGGLGNARNFGIEKCSGEFILPLDSDNKVRPNYLKNAIKIFQKQKSVAVVYGNARKFGAVNKTWKVGKFDKFRLLSGNYIDACAIIRKEVLNLIGTYDVNMPFQGHEDWELWIRIMANGYDFFYLNEICFDYRVTKTSMINSFSQEMLDANNEYLQKKYHKLFIDSFVELQQKWNALKFFTNNFLISNFISIFLKLRARKQARNKLK